MASLNLKIEKTNEENGKFAKYEIYPFTRGYGHTFATPIRRILLSSIKGVSITKLKIKGVDHEFSTIKGIKEDVLRIVLNMSQVVFSMQTGTKESATLKVHGKKVITAEDIKVPGNVTVVNPEFVICELTDDKSQLEIELVIESGYGFELADNEIRNTEPGWIPVNKNFSPIDKVNINVVATRVGQQTDLEKVVLEVWSNGSVSPDAALKEASQIFMDRLSELNEVVQSFDGSTNDSSSEE
jgi:DNA-directed RNA polymerase subunit alpha